MRRQPRKTACVQKVIKSESKRSIFAELELKKFDIFAKLELEKIRKLGLVKIL